MVGQHQVRALEVSSGIDAVDTTSFTLASASREAARRGQRVDRVGAVHDQHVDLARAHRLDQRGHRREARRVRGRGRDRARVLPTAPTTAFSSSTAAAVAVRAPAGERDAGRQRDRALAPSRAPRRSGGSPRPETSALRGRPRRRRSRRAGARSPTRRRRCSPLGSARRRPPRARARARARPSVPGFAAQPLVGRRSRSRRAAGRRRRGAPRARPRCAASRASGELARVLDRREPGAEAVGAEVDHEVGVGEVEDRHRRDAEHRSRGACAAPRARTARRRRACRRRPPRAKRSSSAGERRPDRRRRAPRPCARRCADRGGQLRDRLRPR